MDVVFTELFNKECRDKFHITENGVYQAIRAPDEQEVLNFDELELRFFVKCLTGMDSKNYLLVCTNRKENSLLVDLAFIIPTEFVGETQTLKPVILLQQFAQKFGLTIRVGQQFNKFIFRELIPVEASSEVTKLVEIVNPGNHDFMQSMFVKFEQKGEVRIANCALAYCIDSHQYLAYLTGEKSENGVTTGIAPQLRGRLIPRDLIEASGTLTFWINYSQLGAGKGGRLFRVATHNYSLEVGFTDSNFYIARNKFSVEFPIAINRPNEYVYCSASWQPTKLSLLMLDKSYDEAVSSGADALTEIEKRKREVETPQIMPPNALITWARKQAIAPTIAYNSLADFYQEVVSALQTIPDKVKATFIYNSFWDITTNAEALEVAPRKPKREPDVGALIHGLLFDIEIAKNFQVSPEYPLGRGKLDFLILGHLKSGETANVCVEFKHAHNTKLEAGLLKQLPEYMRTKGCDFGVYCVIFFKGKYFKKPKKYTLENLDIHLTGLASSAGLSNIRILVWDLSYPEPPSKL